MGLVARVGGFLGGVGLVLAAAGPGYGQSPAPPPSEVRVDLYDAKGNRTGYEVIDLRRGTIERFDRKSNRVGSGRVTPAPPPAPSYGPAPAPPSRSPYPLPTR